MIKKLFFLILLSLTSLVKPAIDTTYTDVVGPGIIHYQLHESDGPISINVLEIDLSLAGNSLGVGISNDYIGNGGERTSEFVLRNTFPDKVIIGAVNGDFFGKQPVQAENLMIIDGKLAKGINLNRYLFGITKNNEPFMGKISFEGYVEKDGLTIEINDLNYFSGKDNVSIFNEFYSPEMDFPDSIFTSLLIPIANFEMNKTIKCIVAATNISNTFRLKRGNRLVLAGKGRLKDPLQKFVKPGDTLNIYVGLNPVKEEIKTLIGGLPRLVSEGKRPYTYLGVEGLWSEKFRGKNPRTAVGFNRAKTKAYIVVVDGRQEGISVGMTLYELSDLMISLGCYNALNLDGGGSTSMVVRDKLVNSPSDFSGERMVYNYLFVTTAIDEFHNLKLFDLSPDEISIEKNNVYPLKLNIIDEWGYPVRIPNFNIKWELEGVEGYVDPDYYFNFKSGRKGKITGRIGNYKDSINVRVIK